jgi:dCMP deaminase
MSTSNQLYAAFGISQWDAKYLHQALFLSQWSKDPSKKVGCVIADVNNLPIGQGYNGFPKGVSDDEALLRDKVSKRFRMVHAEMNASIFSTKSLEGSTFYVTHHPCAACAGVMLQHQVGEVVVLKDEITGLGEYWTQSVEEASSMFEEARVPVVVVDKTKFLAVFDTDGTPFNKKL